MPIMPRYSHPMDPFIGEAAPLRWALEDLADFRDQKQPGYYEDIERYKSAAGTVIDFFEKLRCFADYEDQPDVTNSDGKNIFQRIIEWAEDYPQALVRHISLEGLYGEALDETTQLKSQVFEAWGAYAALQAETQRNDQGPN